MPNTVGDTDGKAVVVAEVVDVALTDELAVADALVVVVGELVDVALTDGLAGHALPPGLFAVKSRITVGDGLTRGLSGIGACVGEALAVT
jgi:hypothetical protein